MSLGPTSDAIPNTLAGGHVAEPLLRNFLQFQLSQVATQIDSTTFIDELFSKSGSEVVKEIKDWFRAGADAKGRFIEVVQNYPKTSISLPFVSVVNGSEDESGQAFMNDYGGEAVFGTSPTNPNGGYTRAIVSVPQENQTLIYCAAQEPHLVMYLYQIVKALLYVNKFQFDKYADMRDMVISGKDLEFHPELFPEFAYFKMLTLRYNTNFDIPLAENATIGGINVGLKVATDFTLYTPDVTEDSGPATITDVPSDD